MKAEPKFCGIVLSAGASSRMGRTKALLPWPAGNQEGRTMLSEAVRTLRAVASQVVVVVGRNHDELAPFIAECGAHLALNPEPERGHFSSMQVGLAAVQRIGCDTALLTPVDRPPMQAENLSVLCRAWREFDGEMWGLVPTYKGHRGHPLIAGPQLIERMLREPVESNAHAVLVECSAHLRTLALDDVSVTLNVNTPEEYEQLSKMQGWE